MPLDVLGRTRVTLTETASTSLVEILGKRKSSTCVDYVPALCTHRPSLLPIEWLSEAFGLAQRSRQRHLRAGKLSKLGHLEENSVNHRIFERTLRPLVGIPAELKHINKRRKRNQQGLP
ncbi:hypothetical protein GGR55DRAFT_693327 [Xylaria sp. FL0064]|nr:hypothetical protein GGR55DRAFT_693327 [Xylaria sp. FL0064]